MKSNSYRADIDGLRALAVGAVVLFHAFPNLMPGGYIGVDVFFVISGFLITRILRQEIREDHFSLFQFYVRRIKRLLPALVTVLVATWAAAWFILLPTEYVELGRHLKAGATFMSNILLYREAGYFDVTAEAKPLLHLWSLGIEEQFYLFWPLILLVVSRRRELRWLPFLCFGWSFYYCVSHQGTFKGFFAITSRFWELLIGAGLAVFAIETRYANALAIAAVAIFAPSLHLMTKDTPFPSYYALAPTLATALFLLAEKSILNRKVLTAAPMRWLGKISYPLYLWHWPILVYLRFVRVEYTTFDVLAAMACALVLAHLTWKCVEMPLQKTARTPKQIFGAGVVALVAIFGLGSLTMYTGGFPSRYGDRHLNLLEWSYQFKSWERFATSPACSDFKSKLDVERSCFASDQKSPDVFIWGDSHAEHLIWGIYTKTNPAVSWIETSGAGCPPVLDTKVMGKVGATCLWSNEETLKWIAKTPSIKVVLLSPLLPYYIKPGRAFREDDGRLHFDRPDDQLALGLEEGYRNVIDRLHALGKEVIVARDTPFFEVHPRECVRFLSRLEAPFCLKSRAKLSEGFRDVDGILTRLMKDRPFVHYFDPLDTFCDADSCPETKDGKTMYIDGDHLSFHGSEIWAGAFLPWFYSLRTF